ncbi:oxidoreductase [Spirosoma rigui]|uniref:oxidoreductase n=1 Tax=Spirosoma rigui TaxID=564064 RepID=UPI0009AFFD00|nr:oxidoreductase [Spirosoma rigui]
MAKTVLVTGASAGIGKATAILLAQNGYNVYGAARRIERMHDLLSYGIKPIGLDVTSEESIVNCEQQITNEAGAIDILVNNAGFGSSGAVEDLSIDEARYQLDVNVFGAMRLTQLVLPKMRANNWGKIVNISSIGGKVAFPLAGWYHASKFALEALSDSLRMEVKQFGIDVIVIEPGGVKSEWADISNEKMTAVSGHTAYKDMVVSTQKATTNLALPEPIVIAELIKKGIEAKRPKTRYVGGYGARPILFLRKILPDTLFQKVILSQTKG